MFFPLAASWDYALQRLLNSATARALVSALHRCHGAYNDVSQDRCYQCCDGGCVPSLSKFFSCLQRVWCHRAGVGTLVRLYPTV